MRKIAHLSDLHFGAEDPRIVEHLHVDLAHVRPDLVVVSGDLTQRARRAQFHAARAFLDQLPAPWLAVPGNHDVPLYDVARRFLRPLHRFRRIVSDELCPFFADERVAVLGINTARSLTLKEGRISMEQIELIGERFHALPEGAWKVLVTHHPFVPPVGGDLTALVGRHEPALLALEKAGVDLLLAGHLHLAYSDDVVKHHAFVKRSILVAQAGTATSHRRRGEPNAYNVVAFDGDRVEIEVRVFTGKRFEPTAVSAWARREHRFVLVAEAEMPMPHVPVGPAWP